MTASEQETRNIAFRAPGTDEWRVLVADVLGKDQHAARRARDELDAMLLASLQIQHLVVLAGSGCSRAAGGPSMQALWSNAVGDPPSAPAMATARKVNYRLEDQNIEALLSKVEAFLQVAEDQEITAFLTSSKQVILNLCSAFLDIANLGAHKTFLHRLSRRRARDQRLRVFTTNYDLCFERATTELGGVVLDGFSFTRPRRYDPRFFGYDIIRRPRGGDDLGDYLEGVFLLYKLHGSVNWTRRPDGTICEQDNPAPAETCLIYPAMGKYQQSFVQPHLESMAQYLTAVREPSTCLLVVGVGFNDDHLAEPLLAAVESNPHLRLIVANPEAKSRTSNGNRYWNRLFELSMRGEDVWFIDAGFGDFANLVPDLKSLTPADALAKAINRVVKEA